MEMVQFALFLPKYHSEFNFIENLWGRTKVDLTRNCSCDFVVLQTSIPAAVASVPLAVLRRYARRCDRTMDAYRPVDGQVLRLPWLSRSTRPTAACRTAGMSACHELFPAE